MHVTSILEPATVMFSVQGGVFSFIIFPFSELSKRWLPIANHSPSQTPGFSQIFFINLDILFGFSIAWDI